jgi:hypothetical protein
VKSHGCSVLDRRIYRLDITEAWRGEGRDKVLLAILPNPNPTKPHSGGQYDSTACPSPMAIAEARITVMLVIALLLQKYEP